MKTFVDKKKVLILATGGTLGMQASTDGALQPEGILKNLLTWIPELKDYAEISLEILDDIDSSQMTPDHWLNMARRVKLAQINGEFSGVVILHGTDTLAYSASALSFLLPNLLLPVVITGGQKPLAVTRTDSRNNVLGAVETALEGPIEVCVFFNNTVYRGNRVDKVSIGEFDAFDSPNFPPLGLAGITWEWHDNLVWPHTRRPTIWPEIPQSLPVAPWVLPWTPGLDFSTLSGILSSQWAVIIEAFGTGNLPMTHEIRKTLAEYIDNDGIIFIRSQVRRGRMALEAYAPGNLMKQIGIHGGRDMTREAMVTKLMVLKGLGLSKSEIIQHMNQSLVGELSE